jgi:PKD repeat protein
MGHRQQRAVAAGNDDADANNYSPGGFDNVLSVSALADFDGMPGGLGSPTCRADQDDTLADFSNWGPEIDIAAPGVCILSTYPIEQGTYGTISGTSMASPHAAGALALLASANNPENATDVYNLYALVKSAGNNNWTDDSGDGIQEPLLDVSTFNPVLVPGSESGANLPPVAGFTYTVLNLTATFTDTSTDSDGTIVSWSWDFGDGMTSTVQNPSHTYAAPGTYSVGLTVTDDDGANDATSRMVTVTAPPALPAAPTNLVATAVSRTQINLTWTDNANNEDGFYIERCKGATCTNFTRIATVGANATSYSNTGLSKNTTYRYRVLAYNSAGNSGYSNIASAKTPR